MKKYLSLFAVCLLFASCSLTDQLYNWKGYDDAVFQYTKNRDENSTKNLVKIYEKLIRNSGGSRKVPPPGVCADYGYLLITKGEVIKGKDLLNKEIALYPESKPFIERILKRF